MCQIPPISPSASQLLLDLFNSFHRMEVRTPIQFNFCFYRLWPVVADSES